MLDLYNRTNGPNWVINGTGFYGNSGRNWFQNTDLTSWHGLWIVNGHVEEVILPYASLTGTLPASLANLTEVKWLYLGYPSGLNQITGPIPVELASLTKLEVLVLEQNQMSGPIPPQLGSMPTLEVLSLEGNNFTGRIPPELGNLPSQFRYLGLSDNQLTGPIPNSIGNLTGLQNLYLDGNQLTGNIPTIITNLTNLIPSGSVGLETVDFGYNALTSPNSIVTAFLNTNDPDWATTQTVPPTNLAVSAIGSTSLTLSWTPIPYTADPGSYEIYFALADTGPFNLHSTTNSKMVSSQVITGLTPNTQYFFAIVAKTNPHPNNSNSVSSAFSSSIGARTTLGAPPPNTPPIARNDSYTLTSTATQLTVAFPGVLSNDSDPDGGAISAAISTAPSTGSLNFNSNGSFTYTRAAGFSGNVTFTYFANDGQVNSTATATVTITVEAVPPTAVPTATASPTATTSATTSPTANTSTTSSNSNTSGQTTGTSATTSLSSGVNVASNMAVGRGSLIGEDGVILRQSPSLTSTRLRLLADKTIVEIIGRSSDNRWIMVRFNGVVGWVAANLVAMPLNLNSLPVLASANLEAYPISNTRLRSGPSTSFSQIGRVAANQTVTVLGQSQDQRWIKLQLRNGRIGWAIKSQFRDSLTLRRLGNLPIVE